MTPSTHETRRTGLHCAVLAATLTVLPRPARADCGDAGALVAATERAVVAGRLSAVPELVEQTEQAFACADATAERALLGRWYQAQAAWFSLSDAPEEAALAWRSAELAAPGTWTEALGPKLRGERDAALADTGPRGSGTINLVPPPTGHRTTLDGLEAPFPLSAPPGLHLVQVLEPAGGGAVFARQVFLIDAGELFEIDTGPLAAPSAPSRDIAPPPPGGAAIAAPLPPGEPTTRRSRWPLWAGIGAGALAGTAAILARSQRSTLETSTDVGELDAAWGRQQVYGWSAYGLAGLAVVGIGVDIAL
jgi:hypothetical protein